MELAWMSERASLDEQARRVAAEVDPAQVVELARRLIRIPSVVRPGDPRANEAQVAAFLAEELERRGWTVSVQEAAPGRPNVVADWDTGEPGFGLIVEGHTDVVTEGDRSAWSYDPFGGEVVGGRLYGRGACDMKGGLAAAVVALDAVRRAGHGLRGRVRLAALADEEGMMEGVKAFVRAGLADGFDGAVVCEPEENEVCLVQKGALRVLAVFRGRQAHGAMPYAGANPLPAAARFVLALSELQAAEQRRTGAHPLLGLPWITPTTVRAPAHGDAQFNVMAGEAHVTVDLRTVPGQDHGALLQALHDLAERAAAAEEGVEARTELVEDRPWTQTPRDAPVVQAVERAVRLVTGREPRYGGVPGCTDGTFLQAWAGLPVVVLGPGKREVPHQVDEHVDIDELVEAARIYAAAVVYALGG
ncbi:MAG: M20 family metallopeptidase [bacterium]